MASECAGEQGNFWEYHHLLYENQGATNQGAFNRENLLQFAQDLNLNSEAFSECLNSRKYEAIVLQDRAIGVSNGVRTTPTIFIASEDGAVKLEGNRPFEEVQSAIEELLSSGLGQGN